MGLESLMTTDQVPNARIVLYNQIKHDSVRVETISHPSEVETPSYLNLWMTGGIKRALGGTLSTNARKRAIASSAVRRPAGSSRAMLSSKVSTGSKVDCDKLCQQQSRAEM